MMNLQISDVIKIMVGKNFLKNATTKFTILMIGIRLSVNFSCGHLRKRPGIWCILFEASDVCIISLNAHNSMKT